MPTPHDFTADSKWTEIEHLPEWDEEFYLVYTAKKYGKWVMLKTLRPEFKEEPRGLAMIDKEFDIRYNLAHPNIIMINDLEEVPGLGKCIITDDVYGDSLAKLIEKGQVTDDIIDKLTTCLVDALEYIQANHLVHHPVRPATVIFTENVRNLKVIDVGFDQREVLTPAEASDDIASFARILQAALDALPDSSDKKYAHLRRVIYLCLHPEARGGIRNVQQLKMAINSRSTNRWLLYIAIFLFIMVVALLWINSHHHAPQPHLSTLLTPTLNPSFL